jgi:hypothetical protein
VTLYWLLFASFAFCAALAPGQRAQGRSANGMLLAVLTIAMALMIGLRYEVGADWNVYERIFTEAGRASFQRMLRLGDPGYQTLNWVVSQRHGSITQVNLICGLIFCWGLQRLARQQPEPWLAMVVAIPYLVVVVGMGYTRQAVAIGILMAGLAALQRGASPLRFAAYVAVAALFHKTAVFVLPLVIFAGSRTIWLNLMVGAALCILFYNLFLEQSVGLYVSNYLDSGYSSQGAAIRVALCVVPAILFLVRSRDFGLAPRERTIWRYFSMAALVAPVALGLSPSSTAVDRLALYLLPLQLVVFSRLPRAYRLHGLGRLLVILYSAAILFGWLTFATHARYWIPYQITPLL